MFESIIKIFKKPNKTETLAPTSKESAKERLHLVLMQDRVNVSADFLDLMRDEIIEVIKKYIDIDETAMEVKLTNQENEDGTQGAPALYANIPILNIKEETRVLTNGTNKKEGDKQTENNDSENVPKEDSNKVIEKKSEQKPAEDTGKQSVEKTEKVSEGKPEKDATKTSEEASKETSNKAKGEASTEKNQKEEKGEIVSEKSKINEHNSQKEENVPNKKENNNKE